MQMQLEFDYQGWNDLTQNEKILFMLRRQEWVNTYEFMDADRSLYVARNRICEMNKSKEHSIESRKVEWGKIHEYKLHW